MSARKPFANGPSRGDPARGPLRYARATSVAPEGGRAFDAVLGLGDRASSAIGGALVLAMAIHAGAAVRAALIPVELLRWTERAAWRVHDEVAGEIAIEMTKLAEPEPPPPPPPEEKKEEPAPAIAKVEPPPSKEPTPPPKEEPPPPPPAAAQAGQVLAQEPAPNEVLDLTNTFVQGNANTYAGGTTQAGGTSATAVAAANARAGGVAGGTGTTVAAPAPAVDRSRPPSCNDERQWRDNCPFPPEADTAQIDEATVQVQVAVGPDGAVARVDVLRDPGNGFGRTARKCGLSVRCQPALDPSGRPMAGVTRVNVHFER